MSLHYQSNLSSVTGKSAYTFDLANADDEIKIADPRTTVSGTALAVNRLLNIAYSLKKVIV
jgi:hypothetical protein